MALTKIGVSSIKDTFKTTISGSARGELSSSVHLRQVAATISGSFTSGFEHTGKISGSSTSTGSFGRLEGDGGGITLADNNKINFGSGDDANIKHSGANLQIQNTTGNIQLTNFAADADIVFRTDDGSGGETAYITLDGSTTKVEVAKETNFAGDVTIAGTLTAQEVHTEFESASILFTSGSTRFGDDTTDTHRVTGSMDISGSLNIPHGDLIIQDNIDVEGDIDVNGTTNLDVVDIDGAVTQDGGNFVINEAGANYDFRVESDGNTHALVMDGAQGFIGMGASNPGFVNGNDHRGGNTQTTSGAGGLLHLEGLVPRIILDDTGDNPQFGIEAQDYFSIFTIENGSTAESQRIRINSVGDVGIGTTALDPHSYGGTTLTVQTSGSTGDIGNISIAHKTNNSDGDGLGDLIFSNIGSSGSEKRAVIIRGLIDGATANNAGGRLQISTKQNNSTSFNTAVLIDNQGRFGIGGAPSQVLDLTFSGEDGMAINSTDSNATIFLQSNGTNKWIIANAPSQHELFISSAAVAPIVTIEQAGLVGLGTNNPAAELDVQNSSEARFRVRRGSIYTELAQNSSGGVMTMDKANGDAGIQLVSYGTSFIGRDSVNNLLGIGTTSPVGRVHIHNAGDGSGGVSSGGDEDTLVVSSSIRHFVAQFDNAAGNYDSSVIGLNTPGRSGATAFNFLRAADNSEEKTKIRGDGSIQARNTTLQAFDYAEFFEVALTEHTASGIPAGVTVALTGSKVIPASQSSEEPIGIVRPRNAPAIIGNSPWNHWHAKYKTTDYGAPILDENQNPVVNPSYVSQSYTPREDRNEWVIVGLLGQIPVTNGQPTGSSWKKMHNISPTASMWFVK